MSRGRAAGALAFDTVLGTCVVAWTPAGVRELHLADPAERVQKLRARSGAKGAREQKAASGRPAKAAGEVGQGGVPVEAVRRRLDDPDIVPVTSPAQAPAWVRRLVKRVTRHLDGDLDDLLDVPIDWPEGASAFDRAIWEAARNVPPGMTISYGELADEAGHPGAARAAGSAMRRAPVALLVPAHRVIAAGRRPGGWTGAGGVPVKLRLLEIEGVALRPARSR